MTLDKQYLIFQTAAQPCAAPIEDIREVVLMAELSPPLGLTEFHAGFLNIGGQAIPILYLNRVLNLPELTPGLYSHFLLLRSGSGFLTQSVSSIVRNPQLGPIPASSQLQSFASAMLVIGRQLIPVLNLPYLAETPKRNNLLTLLPQRLDVAS